MRRCSTGTVAADGTAVDQAAETSYADNTDAGWVDEAPSAGELELEDRSALRRVHGLSTELRDVTEVETRRLQLERVVLVGVWATGTSAQAEASLTELGRLAETAGSSVCDGLVQRRNRPDPSTYIGAGKVVSLRETVLATGADTVVCDGELAPGQLRQLEAKLGVKVIDRTALILDIFAQHARSREGKAQVELAQLKYLLPRLRGWGASLSRQAGGRAGGGGGGVGLRGPGETKLETDRRRINDRITRLRRDIAGMRTARDVKRRRRRSNAVPNVAIAGYTNAGKSSLLNVLTNAGSMVDNSLFATLDPTTRRGLTTGGRGHTFTDTVGFVRHLPHQLVEAFRSTLEEVADASLVLHVVDGADPLPEDQVSAVREVIGQITEDRRVSAPPELLVVNKIDAADATTLARLRNTMPDAAFVSTVTGAGVPALAERIGQALPRPEVEIEAMLPWTEGALVGRLHSEGEVLSTEHSESGTRVRALVRPDLAGALSAFTIRD